MTTKKQKTESETLERDEIIIILVNVLKDKLTEHGNNIQKIKEEIIILKQEIQTIQKQITQKQKTEKNTINTWKDRIYGAIIVIITGLILYVLTSP
jgi:tetrahydromethanopterin S-methyltransferase subunit A